MFNLPSHFSNRMLNMLNSLSLSVAIHLMLVYTFELGHLQVVSYIYEFKDRILNKLLSCPLGPSTDSDGPKLSFPS